MIRETVCNYCSYRFRFNTQYSHTQCPICGATQLTDDLILESFPTKEVENDYRRRAEDLR